MQHARRPSLDAWGRPRRFREKRGPGRSRSSRRAGTLRGGACGISAGVENKDPDRRSPVRLLDTMQQTNPSLRPERPTLVGHGVKAQRRPKSTAHNANFSNGSGALAVESLDLVREGQAWACASTVWLPRKAGPQWAPTNSAPTQMPTTAGPWRGLPDDSQPIAN